MGQIGHKYIEGQTLGECIFLKELNTDKKWRVGLFKCRCGKNFECQINMIRSGNTKSCGCYKNKVMIERNLKHGMTYSKEYVSWRSMIERTSNPNNNRYHKYGGVGIKVCERWLESFQNFLDDLGTKPSPIHTVDRIENSKGYYKENCRWATPKEQSRNRSTTKMIKYKGEYIPLIELSERLGLNPKLVRGRIYKGHTLEEALDPNLKKNQFG